MLRLFRSGFVSPATERAKSFVEDHRGVSVVDLWWEPTGERKPVEIVDSRIFDRIFRHPNRAMGAFVDSIEVPQGDLLSIRDDAGDSMTFRTDDTRDGRELWLIGETTCRDWQTRLEPRNVLVARFAHHV